MPPPVSLRRKRRALLAGAALAGCCCLVVPPGAQAFLHRLPSSSSPLVGSAGLRPSTVKVFSRNLGGGLDPPFFFGDNGDENNNDNNNNNNKNNKGGNGQQQPNPQPRKQPPPPAQQQTRPPAPLTPPKFSNGSSPLKLQGFMEGSQKLVPQIGGMPFMTGNNYVDLIVTMSPKEMITNFKAAAPPRVQEAVKRTVLRCIGSIQDSLVEDSHRTTGLIFANLLYKAQVTGYMLFNAEMKVQGLLASSLQSAPDQQFQGPAASSAAAGLPQASLLDSGSMMNGGGGLLSSDDDDVMKLQGVIKITTSDGTEVEVQAQEYVEALKNEAASLKAELVRMEQEKRQLVSRDLLSYISELSTRQSGELTSGMTQDVVEAMKMLVNRVLASIQDRPIVEKESMELDSPALAQLIMWGLVTGYSLRELERAWDYGQPANPSLLNPPSPQQQPPRPRGRRPPPPPPRGSRGRGGDRPPRGGPPPPGGGGGGEGGRGGGGGGGRPGRGGGGF